MWNASLVVAQCEVLNEFRAEHVCHKTMVCFIFLYWPLAKIILDMGLTITHWLWNSMAGQTKKVKERCAFIMDKCSTSIITKSHQFLNYIRENNWRFGLLGIWQCPWEIHGCEGIVKFASLNIIMKWTQIWSDLECNKFYVI